METISFTLDIEPPTVTAQQQKTTVRGGKPCRYDSPALARAKKAYERALLPHKPAEPLEGAIYLGVTFVFPYRKSEPKKNRGKLIPKTTKPDTDNMVKALKDRMEKGGFFKNDSQVFRENVAKYWGATPLIHISISRDEQGAH